MKNLGLTERFEKVGGYYSGRMDSLTIGYVVDTNDPQQMGRVRAICPAYDEDIEQTKISDVAWAVYMSPFGGINTIGTRGNDSFYTTGPVSYGMWNIPKVGSQVIIACIDGDPDLRIWMGCIYSRLMAHTLPHGRYTFSDDGNGPLSTSEFPIQPLFLNQTLSFGPRVGNYEWKTRGFDYSASGVSGELVSEGISTLADDRNVITEEADGTSHSTTQGYAKSRQEPDIENPDTGGINYDSQVYSWTTPGFHAISMDDRPENCRMKMRTTSGHQIILDDTNERIYINTYRGNNWVEMDVNGNIDIHSERRVSVHAAKDINFTTEESFRVHATKGIHLYAGEEIRAHALQDIHVRTEQNLRTHSYMETRIMADGDLHAYSAANLLVKSEAAMSLYSGDVFKAYSGSTMHHRSGANMLFTGGSDIHLNGPGADQADQAVLPEEQPSFWTNRVPSHEPWARVIMDNWDSNILHEAQYGYDDPEIGVTEGIDTFDRNPNWHR